MNSIRGWLLGAGLVALATPLAQAQEQPGIGRQRFDAAMFERMDTNKDGVLELTIPKVAKPEPRKIEILAA